MKERKERKEREAMREWGERKALNQNILCDAVNHLKFSIKAVSNLTPTGDDHNSDDCHDSLSKGK